MAIIVNSSAFLNYYNKIKSDQIIDDLKASIPYSFTIVDDTDNNYKKKRIQIPPDDERPLI